MSDLPARDLSTRTDETASTNWHRLAGSASGTSGSIGSALDARDPESLKERARRYREQTERAIALAEARDEYEDAVYRAGVVKRRIQRHQEAVRRRAERIDRKENRRQNVPVHVEVDPAAWDVVKREALLDRSTIGATVGELVMRSVHDRVIPRRHPHRSSAQRFARLFVDVETWGQFRALALDAHVSAGRLVGLLVEREARRFDGIEQ
jgi:hypothetical protein